MTANKVIAHTPRGIRWFPIEDLVPTELDPFLRPMNG
jgi:hypothetical protein